MSFSGQHGVLDDPKIVEDAKLLWLSAGLRPQGIEKRVSELCAAAYCGDELAAISTAYVVYERSLRNKFFAFRSLTAPKFRKRNLAWRITAYSFKVLQDWSAQNPGERILGLIESIETDLYKDAARSPVRWVRDNLALVGYSRAVTSCAWRGSIMRCLMTTKPGAKCFRRADQVGMIRAGLCFLRASRPPVHPEKLESGGAIRRFCSTRVIHPPSIILLRDCKSVCNNLAKRLAFGPRKLFCNRTSPVWPPQPWE